MPAALVHAGKGHHHHRRGCAASTLAQSGGVAEQWDNREENRVSERARGASSSSRPYNGFRSVQQRR